jgi:hypothetical protein
MTSKIVAFLLTPSARRVTHAGAMRCVAEHWTHARVKHADEEHCFDRKQRALKALDHLVARRERTVLVVTYGTFLCMLIGCMMAGDEVIQI